MQKIAVLEICWLMDVRGRSNRQRVDLAEWAKLVEESTGMRSTSHSAAGTALSQEEEEVGYSP